MSKDEGGELVLAIVFTLEIKVDGRGECECEGHSQPLDKGISSASVTVTTRVCVAVAVRRCFRAVDGYTKAAAWKTCSVCVRVVAWGMSAAGAILRVGAFGLSEVFLLEIR